jgi:hypothetical protein
MKREDRSTYDGPTTAAQLKYLLDATSLLDVLDSTERGVIRRAIELLECLPAAIETRKVDVVQ